MEASVDLLQKQPPSLLGFSRTVGLALVCAFVLGCFGAALPVAHAFTQTRDSSGRAVRWAGGSVYLPF